MGLKIVLSSSRRLDEKNKVIEKLKLMDKALSMLGNQGKRIEYIYDCETASTVFGLMPKQTEINNCLIPKCDWLILLAPLKHVGDKTAGELVAAYKTMKNGANLVINVFACSDPLGAKNEEEYQQKLVENDCVKADSDVYLEQLLQLLRDSYEQIDEHYVVDYRYDSDCSSLVNKVSEQFDLLVLENRFPVFRVDGMSIPGHAVKAKELYYDENRAAEENGFNEKLYYQRESVDVALQNKITEGGRIVMITGMPGAGKTRAVYEFVRHRIPNEKVILLNYGNVHDLIRRFKTDVDYNVADGSGEMRKTLDRIYIIADQVRDVFEMAGMESSEILDFFQRLLKHKNIVFIGTSIKSAYDNFKNNNSKVRDLLMANDNLCQELEIKPIGKSQADAKFVAWLRMHFKYSSGETVGDYIPRLNDYVEKIVNRLVSQKDTELHHFVKNFLRACQLVSTFRYSSPLCLVVMLVRKKYEQMSADIFSKNLLACIKYLQDNNAVLFSHELNGNMINYSADSIYDGEKLYSIVPVNINFAFNELVWEELLVREKTVPIAERLLYDWTNFFEAKNAILSFYETFPTATSLRRMVARLPQTEIYNECLEECRKIAKENLSVLMEEDKEEMGFFYNLLIGRAESRRGVRMLIREMRENGLPVNESTMGELIRFAKNHPNSYTPEEIEDFQVENSISDSLYSISRKLEYFTDTFDEAYAFVSQGAVDAVLAKVRSVNGLFVSDMMSLQRIYGILAKLCANAEHIRLLIDFANGRYAWAQSLVDEVRNYDAALDVLEFGASTIFDDVLARLDSIDNLVEGKAMLNEYVDRLFSLTNAAVVFMLGKSVHDTPMLKLIQSYLESGEGVWASVKANRREVVYVGLIQKSEDFSTAYAFYQSWREPVGEHNARMLAMCLELTKKHEYKFAVKAFNSFEKEMGGSAKISLILYNQILKASPTIDDASVYIKRLPYVDDYTLSNLLRIVDNYKIKVQGSSEGHKRPSPKRFLYAYEVVNMPKLKNYRCDIHVIALLFKMAVSLQQEEYVWKIIRNEKSENDSVGMKRMVEASDEINTMLIKKPYRSIDDAFAIVESVRRLAGDGKMAPDCVAALCGKIADCKDEDERSAAFRRWDNFVSEWNDLIEKDEFFYSALYRFRKLDALFDETGEVSEVFRNDIEGVKATQSRTFGNILQTLYNRQMGCEKMWKFYCYYRQWYEKNSSYKTLAPFRNFFIFLKKAAENNKELLETIGQEEKQLWGPSKAEDSNSIFLHTRFEKGSSADIIAMLKAEIEGGYLMPAVLNSALERLAKTDCSPQEAYLAVMELLREYPDIEDVFTPITRSVLICLASDFEEKKRWLYPEGEEPVIEKLLGVVSTDKVIAANDITITRRYFDLWKNIHDDLGFDSDGNFQTLSGYLRAEIENKHDGYLERVRMVVKIYVDHGRPIWWNTFKVVPWSQICADLIKAYPDERHVWEKVEIYSVKNYRSR